MGLGKEHQKKIQFKLTAFLLIFSVLLSIICMPIAAENADPAASDVGTDASLSDPFALNPEPIETEDQIFERLTADSLLLNYIDETTFRAAGHINRLPEEEDLSSYVFENEDGTRTAYILNEPVKYIDSTGAVREKDLTLSPGQMGNASVMATGVNTEAYTITATNTPMTFPGELTHGVHFTYGDYTITLRPETVNPSTKALQAEGKVLYRNAFGSTAHLMYTPQLNGLKEDIVLTRYSTQNSFTFILNTDGLIPASDAGGYYLYDGTDEEAKLRLGQVISYDANGDFSIGEMTVTHQSGNTYQVTLTVDPDFLANAFYPVTVDPTIWEDSDGTLFKEATIYNSNQNWNYNGNDLYVGFVTTQSGNKPNIIATDADGNPYISGAVISTYFNQTTRSVICPIGLQYNSLFYEIPIDRIVSANMYLYSTDNNWLDMELYRTTNHTWNEDTVIWDALKPMTLVSGTDTTVYGAGMHAFDITSFVKMWFSGVWSLEEGIVLAAANEPTNGNSKQFLVEGTANMPYISITYYSYVSVLYDESRYVQIGSQDYQLTAHIRPSDMENDISGWSWSTSNSTIATVSGNGVVTAISEGTVTITASTMLDGAYISGSATLYVVPVLPETYYIQNLVSNRYITPNTGAPINISNHVEQWTLDYDKKQAWELSYNGNGYYKIKNLINNTYLTSPTSSSSGEKITAETELTNEVDRQFWDIISQSDGTFQIRAKNRYSYVLSSNSANAINGGNIVQNPASNGDVTKWKIIAWSTINADAYLPWGVASPEITILLANDTAKNNTWQPIIQAASNAWNNSGAGVTIQLKTSGVSDHEIYVSSVEETWFGCTYPDLINSSGDVLKSRIVLNTNRLNTDIAQSTTVHELGHLLHLKDNPSMTDDTIMNYGRDRSTMLVPQLYDVCNVKIFYE